MITHVTLAAMQCQPAPQPPAGGLGVLVDPSELGLWEAPFASDAANALGPALASTDADWMYRVVGKGQRLHGIDSTVRGGRQPIFVEDPEITQAMSRYDDLRAAEGWGVAGLGKLETQDDATPVWPYLASHSSRPLTVRHLARAVTVTTDSFMIFLTRPAASLQLLSLAREHFPEKLGMDYTTWSTGADALVRLLLGQVGLDALDPDVGPSCASFTSRMATDDPRFATAPELLLGLMSRGMVRGSRLAWLKEMQTTLGDADDQRARTFLDALTWQPGAGPLDPWLFLDVGSGYFTLDCLRLGPHLEHVARRVTSGGGDAGNQRGNFFEREAVWLLSENAGLDQADLPHPPGRDVLLDGKNYGDADMAILLNDVLWNLDMKSWARPDGYHRGSHTAIRGRQEYLVKLHAKVVARGAALAKRLEREGLRVSEVRSLLVTGDPEYVAPDVPDLWNDGNPTVVSLQETAILLRQAKSRPSD